MHLIKAHFRQSLLSHHVAAVQEEFAKRFFERSRENLMAALEQLEHFINHNEEFSCNDAVIIEVRTELEGEFAKPNCSA